MSFVSKLIKPIKILAPMVGNSELAWRIFARRYGATLCYTEMVHCDHFLRTKANPESNNWYTTSKDDRPLVIQVCGNCPETILTACKLMESHCDAIDINFGCPQDIARKGKYGSYLQEDWKLIEEIITKLSKNLSIPLFCKIRVFESIEKSVEYAKMIEKAGCNLLAVHGRTRDQRGSNTGIASWKHIRAIKQALKIPVISNGNILYREDIYSCLEYTKCDGVMVAETHLYNPLIFTDADMTSIDALSEYLEICKSHKNSAAIKHIKSHSFKLLMTFFRHFPEFRMELDKCRSLEEFNQLVKKLRIFTSDKGDDRMLKALKMNPYVRDLGLIDNSLLTAVCSSEGVSKKDSDS